MSASAQDPLLASAFCSPTCELMHVAAGLWIFASPRVSAQLFQYGSKIFRKLGCLCVIGVEIDCLLKGGRRRLVSTLQALDNTDLIVRIYGQFRTERHYFTICVDAFVK